MTDVNYQTVTVWVMCIYMHKSLSLLHRYYYNLYYEIFDAAKHST